MNPAFNPGPLETQIKLGDKVEVEGPMLNGVIIAMKVEVRGGSAEASSKVGIKNIANNNWRATHASI